MNRNIAIAHAESPQGTSLAVTVGGECWMLAENPLCIHLLGFPAVGGKYASLQEKQGSLVGEGTLAGVEGTEVQFVDTWTVEDGGFVRIDRIATVVQHGQSKGFRIELRMNTTFPNTRSLDDYELFIPGSLYKKNDTDHDGKEDYLGTYAQDYRDDRLASMSVLVRIPRLNAYVALSRVSLPMADSPITKDMMLSRHFVQETDIGSLGIRPIAAESQLQLRARFPFAEENTFCLNTNREGWSAYRENVTGHVIRVSYCASIGVAESLTDAIWKLTRSQMTRLGTSVPKANCGLEEALEYRMSLTQKYYEVAKKARDGTEPAGYMVHFSPRTGKTLGTLLEYGFSGAQTLLAYTSLRYGYMKDDLQYVDHARRVIDFFVSHCQLPNGYSHGIYDTAKDDFVYWFTGVLMPFQYADGKETLRSYLGSQVMTALAPIAEQLKTIKGNYLRYTVRVCLSDPARLQDGARTTVASVMIGFPPRFASEAFFSPPKAVTGPGIGRTTRNAEGWSTPRSGLDSVKQNEKAEPFFPSRSCSSSTE